MSRLFGTDGVRGVFNVDLTPEVALKLGLAIGSYFGSGSRIIVGNDFRAGSLSLSNAVISGLLSCGIRVYYAGFTPTPALQYYIKEKGFDGGVMITASHNPPQYNGIKVIMDDGIEASREVEKVIEDYYFSLRFKRVKWRYVLNQVYSVHDVNDFYVRGVLKLVDKDLISKRGFKVVADLANNVSSLTTPKLLRELSVKVLTINGDMSHEPYRTPEPNRESLSDLYKVVTAVGADLGLAHDGDADRVIFIDELGNFIPGDYSATLLARYLVERDRDSPKRVVTAVSSSVVVEEVLKPLGVEVIWTKVGSIGIARLMKRVGALCGFEENGGFMYPKHQYVRDGAMTIALMLEYLAKEKTTLSKALSTIPKYYLIKTKVPMDRERAFRMVEKVKEVYSKHKYIDIDGVKVFEKDYWFLVRPSGTEPLLRVIVEGRTKGIAEKVLSELMKLIKEGG